LPVAPARHVRLRHLGRRRRFALLCAGPLRHESRSTTRWSTIGLYFASEAKAILPFLPEVETDVEGLRDYLVFQFCLAGKTLFKGIREVPAGHMLRVLDGKLELARTGRSTTTSTSGHDSAWFEERLRS